MRDGIPRTIPVPRKWQIFVECSDRPADRGTDRVVDRLLDAIRSNFAKYLPADQRKKLVDVMSTAQLALPGIELPRVFENNSIIPGRSHHLQELLVEAQKSVHDGNDVQTAIRDALAARIESDAVAHLRQISEDLASKCSPKELERVRTEMNRAAGLLDAMAEADRILQKNLEDRSAKKKISPDEDLR